MARKLKSEEEQPKGLGDPILLEKIDKLFACNVGEHVNLPQLVVVGDQSSGKSSVLAGLMRLPFPRDSGLCTRFATQIIFRRSAEEKIVVSIIPDVDASPEHANHVKAWSVTDLKSLDANSFARIMKDANIAMGLSGQEEANNTCNSIFSNDVLRIEISGKDEEHLSVIDVPGIFKNTTAGLTTKADIALVRSMVQGYMENPRSVMLTVVPANVDVATQEILEMAHDVDPEGHRTLGVLTKPDLVDQGAEPRVVDMLAGRVQQLRLGWHVVRNLGQQQLSDTSVQRQNIEKEFFRARAPWCNIDKAKVGIEALRVRLQDVLAHHIRREFPKVRTEIGKKLRTAQGSLKALGVDRESPERQAAFLMDLSNRFQKIVSLALDAKYGSDNLFDDDPSFRLATAVVSRNSQFAAELEDWGLEYQFSSTEDRTNDLGSKVEKTPPSDDGRGEGSANIKSISTRKIADSPELEDILHEAENLPACKQQGISEWIKTVYESSRGFGLGTFNSSILATTMKKQSSKWTGLALGYGSDVVTITHTFITKLLASICTEEHVTRELLSALMDGLRRRYVNALDQVQFLLDVERMGTPMTLDNHFNDNLEKCRQNRMKIAMKEKSFDEGKHGPVVRLDDVVQNHPMSNVEHIVHDIHDILLSYYEIARKRFVDSVYVHAVDHFLINGSETPLTLFSPEFVLGLDVGQLEMIAGEDTLTKRKRQQLKKEIESLEAGRRILA